VDIAAPAFRVRVGRKGRGRKRGAIQRKGIMCFKNKNKSQNIRSLCLSLAHANAIPLQAWTGPEDYRTLRLPDFKTIGT
jgi:hypothetical protein